MDKLIQIAGYGMSIVIGLIFFYIVVRVGSFAFFKSFREAMTNVNEGEKNVEKK